MFDSQFADASSWEGVSNDSTYVQTSRDLDEYIAIRENMMKLDDNKDDISTLSLKELLTRYKDVKSGMKQLLQDINQAEEKRKKIEDNISTVRRILLNDFYLENNETMQLLDKAVANSQDLIKALDIPTKRALYDKHRVIIANFQDLLQEAQKETEANTERTCSICFEEQPSHVITPCGHVMCGTCKTKMNDGRARVCHVCRGYIRDFIKFYL